MFKAPEQALCKVVRSVQASAVSNAQIQILILMKLIAERIVRSVLFNTALVVPIAELVAKLMDKAVDEHGSRDIKAASTSTTGSDPFIDRALPPLTMPSKTTSHSELHKELRRSHCHNRSPPRCHSCKKSVSNGLYTISDTQPDKSSKLKSSRSRKPIDMYH